VQLLFEQLIVLMFIVFIDGSRSVTAAGFIVSLGEMNSDVV